MKQKTLNTTVSEIKDTKGEFTLCNNGHTLTENYQDCYRVICQFENPNEPYARLIAAAPHLLAACLMADEELCFGGDWVNAKRILKLAIAKATNKE